MGSGVAGSTGGFGPSGSGSNPGSPVVGSIRWECEHMFLPLPPPFSEAALRNAVGRAECWADVLRSLGYDVKGSNYCTVQRWVKRWGISVDHFDPDVGRRR